MLYIWRRMVRAHYFDEQVYKAVESKRVKCFAYLSSGQEAIAAAVATAFDGYAPAIFCQHRSHAAYLSFGGDPRKLRDELLSGHGGDPMINDPAIKFFGHSGLVADQVPIAVGYALAALSPVVCFCGDATVEEDVFWPAVGVAASKNLPILFVVEDNGLSVITRTETRRSWSASQVAAAYGIQVHEDVDNPDTIRNVIRNQFLDNDYSPLMIKIACCRQYRHVGIGADSEMAWNRMDLVRLEASEIDANRTEAIERAAADEMRDLWE